jgi:hypothetical protein
MSFLVTFWSNWSRDCLFTAVTGVHKCASLTKGQFILMSKAGPPLLQTHKKSLRIQQYPASAFTAAIQKAKRTRQARHHRNTDTTSRNSTATHAHQWAHACQPVPLDFASTPRHARYMKKFPLHSPMLSSRQAPATNDARLPGWPSLI